MAVTYKQADIELSPSSLFLNYLLWKLKNGFGGQCVKARGRSVSTLQPWWVFIRKPKYPRRFEKHNALFKWKYSLLKECPFAYSVWWIYLDVKKLLNKLDVEHLLPRALIDINAVEMSRKISGLICWKCR